MAKVYAMIADGTEEVECLSVVDILRRAKIDTVLVSAGDRQIKSSHGIVITTDKTAEQTDFSDGDLIFLPGGIPGSNNLASNKKLMSAIDEYIKSGKRVAAVCAAPAVVLGVNGFLNGKNAVCYPGYEKDLLGANVKTGARVVTDGNVTTARGLGCSIELGLELVKLLVGENTAQKIKEQIQF